MASTNRDEISRLELLHAAHPDGLVFPHLADAYRRAGRYAQAETVLNAGLRRHSEYSSAHVVLGRLRLDQGKYLEAEEAFRRVLELDPENQVAMEHLGQASLEQGRLEDALHQFRKLARVKPGEEVEERVRELTRRVIEMRQGERSGNGPERPGVPVAGNGSASRGPPVDSVEESQEAEIPEPGEVVTETMAELYTRQGLHDRAAAVYRQLLARSPGDSRLRGKLNAVEAELHGDRMEAPATPAPSTPAPDASAPTTPAPATTTTPVTIRDQLSTLLAWQPAGPSDPALESDPDSAPESDPEPWADAEVSPLGELADSAVVLPGTRPEPGKPGVATPAAAEGSSSEVAAPGTEASGEPTDGASGAEPVHADDASGAEPVHADGVSGAEPVHAPGEGQRMDAAARSMIAITDMLVGLLEYRDPFFRGSSSLTRLVAEKVAEEMGLAPAERVDLALAAVLRDLGRLAMGGRLVAQSSQQTPESRRKIERHVDLALHLLEGIDVPQPVRLAVRHHHERWDGAGYPDGLAGKSIPPLARVLAVVDSFGAMVSPRSYRLPRKVPDAAREIRAASGTQYDPEVVDALMRVVGRKDQPHLGFEQRPHLLLVNPDQPGAVVTAAKLCSAGYLAEVSADPAAARERLRRVPVAALVVSAEAGEEAAAAFVRELRVDPLFSALPVVVVDAPGVALRVRLLESGADVCFPPGTSYAELHGTLGALVRRTLRAGRGAGAEGDDGGDGQQEAPWLALQGDVEDFPLTWLLQVMKYDSRTAAIGIRTGSEEGAIYLRKGDAVHAQISGGPTGEAALRRMLQWERGRFTVQPDARARERTIQTSIMHLLLTQAVDEDHAAAGIFGAVSEEG